MTTLYVSSNGSDVWSGRLPEANATRTDGPLATLALAREIARGLKHVGGVTVTVRGERMTLARYPNEAFLHIATLSVEDGYHVRGARGSRVGRFGIEGEAERLRRWAAEPNAMLHGYWFWDWADQRMAVKSISPETGEITLDDIWQKYAGAEI